MAGAGAGTPALVLRGVTKVFSGHLGLGRKAVVQDLSLEVRRGEIFGFLGANGAGKTTTIKLVVGLIFPTRGSIEILGRPGGDVQARERLGYLPENPYFYDYLTAEEFLRYYGQLYGMAPAAIRERVPQVLARVGLAPHGGVALRKFSKGMVQRVGLAQAILNRPDLVVLDEPMSGLDPIGRRDVRDIMLELRAAGTTVFFSSHILQDAEMVCDRVAILSQGRLVKEGALSELLRGEVEAFEVVIRGQGEGLGPALAGLAEVIAGKEGRLLLRVADPAKLPAVLEKSQAVGARVEQVTPQRMTLEDLFLQTSGQASGRAAAAAPPGGAR